ncbi:thioesterase II family protein [Nonomuraea recticatena]|uniref:thioesterase II family protein n=1 Tax=Nonomuraea recticatena TaxID=46178 RepID=UPI0036147308
MTEWVSLPCPRPEAAIRLFCLPYAGGGSVEYQQWADLLPATVEVAPVHLPGRERRIRQQPYTVMKELVADLADGLEPYLDRPYALFGYSLGAWVAFEVARSCAGGSCTGGSSSPVRSCSRRRGRPICRAIPPPTTCRTPHSSPGWSGSAALTG